MSRITVAAAVLLLSACPESPGGDRDASLPDGSDAGDRGVACPLGLTRCAEVCVSLQTNAAHCGACDAACDGTHGTAGCSAGVCQISCALGFASCDGQAANGCEVDLQSDVSSCGSCGRVCAAANATATCEEGSCRFSCLTGFADCDGDPDTGCEVNLLEDLMRCGGCGNACNSAHGVASCALGQCEISCPGDYQDCDGTPDTGCEAHTKTDPQNCGSCGTPCDPTEACMAGECKLSCDVGYDNCFGQCVDLTTDVANCGACGNACAAPLSGAATGEAVCAAGSCGVTCGSGFAECSPPDSANGATCVDLKTDPQFCDDCAKACGPGATCGGFGCDTDACAKGLTPCYDRCVNLKTDPSRCGSCSNDCDYRADSCEAGHCKYACSSGLTQCHPSWERTACTDLQTDPANCGSCGHKCQAGQLCSAGSCRGFIYASGCWECGNGNTFSTCCTAGGDTVCLAAGQPCP